MADFGYGEALFEVWDGENEVGAGVVGFGGSVRRFDGGSLVEAR